MIECVVIREATLLKALLFVLRTPVEAFDGALLVVLFNPDDGLEEAFSFCSISSRESWEEARSTASGSSLLDESLDLLLSGLNVTSLSFGSEQSIGSAVLDRVRNILKRRGKEPCPLKAHRSSHESSEKPLGISLTRGYQASAFG